MNKQRDAMRFLHMGCGESLRSSGLSASCGVRTERRVEPERWPAGVKLEKGGKRRERQR